MVGLIRVEDGIYVDPDEVSAVVDFTGLSHQHKSVIHLKSGIELDCTLYPSKVWDLLEKEK